MRPDLSTSVFGMLCLGFLLSLLDLITCGSMMLLRASAHLGFSSSAYGLTQMGLTLLVLDLIMSEFFMPLQGFHTTRLLFTSLWCKQTGIHPASAGHCCTWLFVIAAILYAARLRTTCLRLDLLGAASIGFWTSWKLDPQHY